MVSQASVPTLTADTQELLRAYRASGDQRIFEEIMRRNHRRVFAVCSRITRNAHDAEDATQAVFLTLSLEARGGTEIRKLTPWLALVAKRVSLDLKKASKRRVNREDRCRAEKPVWSEDDPGGAIDDDELKTAVRQELDRLPSRYRTPMILYYFGGQSSEAIARELNCRPKTLAMRLFRGRKMLAERLAAGAVPVSAGALAVVLGSMIRQGVTSALSSGSALATPSSISASFGGGGTLNQILASVARMVRATNQAAAAAGPVKLAIVLILAISSFVGGAAEIVHRAGGIRFSPISAIKNRLNLLFRDAFYLRPTFSENTEPEAKHDNPPIVVNPSHIQFTQVWSPNVLPAPSPSAAMRLDALPEPFAGGAMSHVSASSLPTNLAPPVVAGPSDPFAASAPLISAHVAPSSMNLMGGQNTKTLHSAAPSSDETVAMAHPSSSFSLSSKFDPTASGLTNSAAPTADMVSLLDTNGLDSTDGSITLTTATPVTTAAPTLVTPEPSGVLLIAAGAGILLRRRRKQNMAS